MTPWIALSPLSPITFFFTSLTVSLFSRLSLLLSQTSCLTNVFHAEKVVDLILAKLSPSAVDDETGTPAAAPSSSSSSAPSTSSVVNLSNQMGCSPTWLAAGYGHLDVLDRLLSVGGDPNTCNGKDHLNILLLEP
jgi:hypothetical protein